MCGKMLGQHVVHPALCDAGAAKLRTHNALKFVLAQELRAEGAFVDVEGRVPDLYKRLANGEIREAILELVVEWPGAGRRHLIVVTVRCPHAVRYPSSATKVGIAAASGDRDKRDRLVPRLRRLPWNRSAALKKAHASALPNLQQTQANTGKLA